MQTQNCTITTTPGKGYTLHATHVKKATHFILHYTGTGTGWGAKAQSIAGIPFLSQTKWVPSQVRTKLYKYT